MGYEITFEEYQACCFWFVPKETCKQFSTDTLCREWSCSDFKQERKKMKMEKDKHVPGKDWKFDESVTKVFDDMLQRSIPQYEVMREAVRDIAFNYMKNETGIIDLGCSKGDAIAGLAHMFPYMNFYGLDVSQSMLAEAEHRFRDQKNVKISYMDLKEGLDVGEKASVIFSVLTIQFTPIEYRMEIIKNIYDQLEPGGALIIVEKVLGESAELDVLFREKYHALKGKNGYSKDDIDRKRLALSGVLVPITAKWNESMMRSAGFSQVDCFWRWMNFAGWVAIK